MARLTLPARFLVWYRNDGIDRGVFFPLFFGWEMAARLQEAIASRLLACQIRMPVPMRWLEARIRKCGRSLVCQHGLRQKGHEGDSNPYPSASQPDTKRNISHYAIGVLSHIAPNKTVCCLHSVACGRGLENCAIDLGMFADHSGRDCILFRTLIRQAAAGPPSACRHTRCPPTMALQSTERGQQSRRKQGAAPRLSTGRGISAAVRNDRLAEGWRSGRMHYSAF